MSAPKFEVGNFVLLSYPLCPDKWRGKTWVVHERKIDSWGSPYYDLRRYVRPTDPNMEHLDGVAQGYLQSVSRWHREPQPESYPTSAKEVAALLS